MSKEDPQKQELLLMQKVADGDKDAFQRLYEATHEKVYYYLVRFVGQEIAEDTLVETFLQVWKSSASFRGNSRVSTWIISIARNLALKGIRKNSRYQSYEDLDHLVEKESNSKPQDEVESIDRTKVMKKAIAQLGEKHQEVLDLFFYHQMTYAEIAEIMDISINTVKTRIFYAKDQLSGVLHRMGVGNGQI